MRIALLADTHLPRFGGALPRALVDGIRSAGVERILHAGDWTSTLAVELLEGLAPVVGVAGNNDPPELHERFGTRRVVELGGVRVGLTHGHLGPGRSTPERAARAFEDETGIDAIVFGHSHIPVVERRDGAPWLVNPGSPTDRRRQPAFTWALMTVTDGRIEGVELRAYADRSA